MRITIVISSLEGGGAQRVAVNMANHWVAIGREVAIATLFQRGRPSTYQLDPRVQHVDAVLVGPRARDEGEIVAAVRSVVIGTRPDVVLSLIDLTNVRVAMALRDSGIPVFAWEQVESGPLDKPEEEAARREAYEHLVAGVIVPTEEDALYFGPGTHVLFNPVAAQHVDKEPGPPIVLAMGRLEEQKGFDVLVAAFARVAGSHPDWKLRIYGDGSEHDELLRRAAALGIAGRLEMPGFTRDPLRAFARAELFALPSRYEGFPNVLLEAMACGIAPIVSDCSPCIREIVRDGIDGLVVEPRSVTDFAEALDRLMRDGAERRRLGARASEVATRFSIAEASMRLDQIFLTRRREAAK